MIIATSGRIGSGKDTVGLIIQYLDWYKAANSQGLSTNMSFEEWLKIKTASFPFNHKHWEIKKFAGKLKQITSILTGATLEQLEDQDFKKLDIGPDWEMTYRQLLQKLGTEAMRNGLHENVWINALFADYKPVCNKFESKMLQTGGNYTSSICSDCDCFPNWIITDMRFENEFDAVKARGGITIRVNTNRAGFVSDHPSETALDNHKFDFVIDNDGSISDLIDKVKEILTLNNII
jgi:hypothetical protein